MPQRNSSSATAGVMPKPAAEFSTFAMTTSIACGGADVREMVGDDPAAGVAEDVADEK